MSLFTGCATPCIKRTNRRSEPDPDPGSWLLSATWQSGHSEWPDASTSPKPPDGPDDPWTGPSPSSDSHHDLGTAVEAGFALPAFPFPVGRCSTAPTYPSRHAVRADGSQAPRGFAGAPELPGLFAIADPRRTGHCGTERSCVRAFTIDRPRSVTAGDPPARLGGKPVPGGQARGGSCGQHRESPRPATGSQAGRLGTGPAVVPGQDPAEGARPTGDGAVADLAVRDPKRGSGHGKRREPGLPARSRDAGPVAVTVPCAARTPRGTDEGSWSAVRVNTA